MITPKNTMKTFLESNSILATISGSRAYGIDTPESDLDIKGVFAPNKRSLFGLETFDQLEDKNQVADFVKGLLPKAAMVNGCEGTFYDVRKFVRLAADANPSMLDILFCREQDVIQITPLGRELRENRELFLSKKVKYTYSGYAISQLKRIISHRKWFLNPPEKPPTRQEFGLTDRSEVAGVAEILDSVRKKIDSWAFDLSGVEESTKKHILQSIENQVFDLQVSKFEAAAVSLGITGSIKDVLVKENSFREAQKNWEQYQEWKTKRNPKRFALESKFLYDTKHAAHLVRLLFQAKEILQDGTVNTFCKNRAFIKSIRAGVLTFEELFSLAEDLQKEIEVVMNQSQLPSRPNTKAIDDMLLGMLDSHAKTL
jgi:predicted nucleotidyltransferase